MRLQGATRTDPSERLSRTGLLPEVERNRRSGLGRPMHSSIRRRAASGSRRIRPCVRGVRRCSPFLRLTAFPPPSPPPIRDIGFVRGFPGTIQSSDASPLPRRLRLLDFPSWPAATLAAVGEMRSPRFRRGPFVRELVSDPGRATGPRITAPLMLPSTLWTVSAPALKHISWLNTDPTRLLCTLRRGRHRPRRNTRYQAGATPYLGRTSTGWTAPASPGAPKAVLEVAEQHLHRPAFRVAADLHR